ncbi:4-hydroxyphenylacetate 3-hydroxylase [Bacillus bingmayongensis]|uniref:4-hydroxyphenylacetate 3-hydroxylase family protein n=1 Tax=Bacillus bingmayongensis TaxID=1150157 RepID=UPI00054D7970|nr:4-hydroxyphenylacetate 3-hydroxylase N-terminal domain-containing protein [Bacillus bingmayongensis]MBY0598382.1 4-hydroxyphenylacetate 3-hydroxylase [Bacillus bingmayongensis]
MKQVGYGQKYLSRLNDGRNVWLQGELVKNIDTHPAFEGTIQTFAKLLDMQNHAETRDKLTFILDENKDRANLAFLVPKTTEDLARKREAYKVWSDATFGVMSRLSEYSRSLITGWYASRHRLGKNVNHFAEKIERYYQKSCVLDLLSTTAVHDPQIDRSKKASEMIDPYTMVRIVKETEDGIVVRGAKMIATAAPYVDELLVFPYHKRPQEDTRYATMFAVSVNTPGVHIVCRESFASEYEEDHPLSARFDEMDSVVIFEDVLIPWERVFIKDDPEAIWKTRTDPVVSALSQHQTVVRLISKLEFITALGNEIAVSIGVTQFLHVKEKLAELIMQLETIKALLLTAEHQAKIYEGIFLPAIVPLTTARNLGTRFYPRAIEILQQIGAGGLLQLPSELQELQGPIGHLLHRYYNGADRNAEKKVRLFKLAWDIIGSPLGARHELYERYYSGDPVRTFAAQYQGYDTKKLTKQLTPFL